MQQRGGGGVGGPAAAADSQLERGQQVSRRPAGEQLAGYLSGPLHLGDPDVPGLGVGDAAVDEQRLVALLPVFDRAGAGYTVTGRPGRSPRLVATTSTAWVIRSSWPGRGRVVVGVEGWWCIGRGFSVMPDSCGHPHAGLRG